jgi:ATP-dependent Clp protease ATP-binding subunit ClpB
MQLEIERQALKSRKMTRPVANALERWKRNCADLKGTEGDEEPSGSWRRRRSARSRAEEADREVKLQIEEAQRHADYEKAATLQYGSLPELQKQLEAEKDPPTKPRKSGC